MLWNITRPESAGTTSAGRLTLNLGLRYEFLSPNTEQDNKIRSTDRLLHAGTGTDMISTAPGHIYSLHFVGGSSLGNRALVNPDYKDFGPRLGFAWQPRPDVVLRGGYGISYAFLFASAAKDCWLITVPTTTRLRCR